MKRPGDEHRPPGGHAERRRRLFEASRGLFGRRALPPDEDGTVGEPAPTEIPPEDDEQSRDESEQDVEGDER